MNCPHNSISLEGLFIRDPDNEENYYTSLIQKFMYDADTILPNLTEHCTYECKEKMIKIVQLIFNQYRDDLCWYYQETNPGVGEDGTIAMFNKVMKSNPELQPNFAQYFNYTVQMNQDGNFPPYPANQP